MCACGNKAVSTIHPVKISALAAAIARLGSGNVKAEDASIGLSSLPTGESVWYVSHGSSFQTDLFGYQISGSVTFTDHDVTMSAAASKDGKEVASFKMVIELQKHGINRISSVKSVEATSDGEVRILNDLKDCLQRHGKDVGICCLFGCSEECLIAIAVGVAACCLVNTHC